MLVVMMVIAFIAIAAAPLLYPKKIKKSTVFVPHGIFECYYKKVGDEYKLYQYFIDNDKNKNGQETLIEGENVTSCTFNPPTANYYRIQAVGAGGQGSQDEVDYTITTVEDSENSGSVELDDLASLPQWVKDNWPYNRIPVSVNLESPIGKAGNAYCTVELQKTDENGNLIAGCENVSGTVNNQTPEQCVKQIIKKGSRSGPQTEASFDFYLHYSDQIYYSGEYYFSIFTKNNKTIKLYKSQEGNGYPEGCPDPNLNCNAPSNDYFLEQNPNFVAYENDFENVTVRTTDPEVYNPATGCATWYQSEESRADDGTADVLINGSDRELDYSKNKNTLNLSLGNNGKNGNVSTYTFADLRGSVVLTPAKTTSDTSSVSGAGINISAQSGEVGTGLFGDEQIITDSDFNNAFPISYNPKNKVDLKNITIGAINDTGLDSKLESLIDNGDIKPGQAGCGSYPFIETFEYNPSMIIGGVTINNNSSATSDTNITTCADGSEPSTNSVGHKYCKGEIGNPGFVRIVW